MNATPRPWTVRKNDVGRCVIEHQPVGGLVSHLAVLKDAWLCEESGGTVDANAQLIVRAVNSFDAMLDALEAVAEEWERLECPLDHLGPQAPDWIRRVKTALALAKGEVKP